MGIRSLLPCAACTAMLLGTTVVAAPFDLVAIEHGAATGALAFVGRQTLQDGLDLHFGVEDYIANKDYSFQVLPPGSGEKSESYVQFSLTSKAIGFVSALATDRNLEVGAQLMTGGSDLGWAVSRSRLHIKNNIEDQSLDTLRFHFTIPDGKVTLTDFTARWFPATHARVEATIDYVLESPFDGGGVERTSGNLFKFFVDLQGTGTGGLGTAPLFLTRSDIDLPFIPLFNPGFSVTELIDGFSDTVRLPVIPPFGALTVYYDMYGFAQTLSEGLGSAFLGDPTDLIDSGSFSVVIDDSPGATVPEPATLFVVCLGLIVIG